MRGATKVLTLEGEIPKALFGVNKAFVGFAGNADVWADAIGWFHNPEDKPPKLKGIEFLMLTDKKQIFHGTNLRNWMLLSEKHFSIGSGMPYALAAMSVGKTPLEAVKVASKHDVNTGLGFLEYTM